MNSKQIKKAVNCFQDNEEVLLQHPDGSLSELYGRLFKIPVYRVTKSHFTECRRIEKTQWTGDPSVELTLSELRGVEQDWKRETFTASDHLTLEHVKKKVVDMKYVYVLRTKN